MTCKYFLPCCGLSSCFLGSVTGRRKILNFYEVQIVFLFGVFDLFLNNLFLLCLTWPGKKASFWAGAGCVWGQSVQTVVHVVQAHESVFLWRTKAQGLLGILGQTCSLSSIPALLQVDLTIFFGPSVSRTAMPAYTPVPGSS